MPNLRDLRDRIVSVKSTRKITSAMKMVAASKLKRAQDQAEASQPYAQAMSDMMSRLAADVDAGPDSPKLMIGTGKDDVHLLVIVSADRGLCGGFNGNIIRMARLKITALEDAGKTVRLICMGRKIRDALRREHPEKIVESFTGITGQKRISYSEVNEATQLILDEFENGGFDVCTLLYNQFQSVLVQKPSEQQLIPLSLEEEAGNDNEPAETDESAAQGKTPYEFEPDQDTIFHELLPRNLGVQIFKALLDSSAGEQAARMTAMDNATRNAGDLINDLTLQYNRERQAYITKELIEIISGAEAL